MDSYPSSYPSQLEKGAREVVNRAGEWPTQRDAMSAAVDLMYHHVWQIPRSDHESHAQTLRYLHREIKENAEKNTMICREATWRIITLT
mgnify:CR=1 FL=1